MLGKKLTLVDNIDFLERTPRIWAAIKRPVGGSCQEEKSILQVIV